VIEGTASLLHSCKIHESHYETLMSEKNAADM